MGLSRKINYIIEFFFLAAAIYILTFFVGCTKQEDIDTNNKVLGENFIIKDGLIYEKNNETPFEGRIIDTVKNKIIEYDVADGKKNGEFVIHYENGSIQIKGIMKDNKNEGIWTYFYPSGKIESQGLFKNDKVNDKWTWYYENGKVKETGIFVDGKREGKWNMYNKDGNLNAIIIFRNGKIVDKMSSEKIKSI